MVDLYIGNLEDVDEKKYEEFYNETGSYYQGYVEKFRNKEDKYRSLYAQHILKKELKNRGIKNQTFKEKFNGKRYLENEDVYFNISHSKDLVVVAIDEKDIGVDVEKEHAVDYLGLASYFMDEEYEYLKNCDIDRLEEEFYKLWTSKESYVKLTGTGLFAALDSFVIKIKQGETNFFVENREAEKLAEISTVNEGSYRISIAQEKIEGINIHNVA